MAGSLRPVVSDLPYRGVLGLPHRALGEAGLAHTTYIAMVLLVRVVRSEEYPRGDRGAQYQQEQEEQPFLGQTYRQPRRGDRRFEGHRSRQCPRSRNCFDTLVLLPTTHCRIFCVSIVTVTAQDFAKLSFAEQVRLSHSASVFLSMHGAGTTHIFHMAVGQVIIVHHCKYMHMYVHT